MYISKFKIENYKSFLSTNYEGLSPGFNVVVGQNNVGKTTLLEALSLQFLDRPHRSKSTIPFHNSPQNRKSTVSLTIEFERKEILTFLSLLKNPIYVPVPDASPGNIPNSINNFNDLINSKIKMDCSYFCDYGMQRISRANIDRWPGSLLAGTNVLNVEYDPANGQFINTGISGIPEDLTFGYKLATALKTRLYRFKAERINSGDCLVGDNEILAPDGSNLAEVLNCLQSNANFLFKINQHINQIFPEVKRVTLEPYIENKENKVRLLIWNDLDTNIPEHAIHLSECGSGIGQVLGILYVVITSHFPQTVIFDEPQNFLHPGAIRKLFSILKQYPQHQYIISTHSPTVVTESDPSTLLLLRKNGPESQIERLDINQTKDKLFLLEEIGARLADVFGADNILWVEGATEEICFKVIIEKVMKSYLLGTAILGVVNTGDFQSKYKELIIRIYKRLSHGEGLFPPALGYIFDREKLSLADIDNLERMSPGKIKVLKRRMYENYLINPKAILSIIIGIDGFKKELLRENKIAEWIDKNKWDNRYINKTIKEEDRTSSLWLKFPRFSGHTEKANDINIYLGGVLWEKEREGFMTKSLKRRPSVFF